MRDRNRLKNSMVHIRFTDAERRRLKAVSALEGASMQEYIRQLVIKRLEKVASRVKL